MSRIDEARRQASTVKAADAPQLAPSPREPVDFSVLGHYPLEPTPEIHDPADDRATDHERVDEGHNGRKRAHLPADGDWVTRLVTSDNALPMAIEQYRRLAASLHDLQVERGLKTVMVTSALPQDGKTLTAVNLALTLSESYGRRVLLMDADLRHPSVQEVFNLPKTGGLSDFLRSTKPEPPVVGVTSHLSILPAGRADSNPMSALTSGRMGALLESCASRFDWVVVDTPPVGLLPDGQVLARLIRAVVFVVRAGTTPAPVVEKAVNELGRDSIVGAVLNAVEDEAIPATGYYRKYYRRDYGTEVSSAGR